MVRSRPRSWLVGLCWTFLLAANGTFAAAIDEVKAAQVKAAWLKNIAALTTWPQDKAILEKTDERDSPIVIGVLGSDPNGVISFLRSRINTPKGLLAQGRPLQLLEVKLPVGDLERDSIVSLLAACDLLFLSADGESDWTQIKPLIELMPIVTVSEFEDFARQGGVIEYFIDVDKGRVFMIVNIDAMKRAGVVLSARLLSLTNVIILRDEANTE